ncbi:pao retrotransposon peptidase domain-containing protein [Phthorimaea operculella]|nr:pao retrotransposon peptidase domain-containing protein [Phthorimaea operculella]
MEKISKDRKVRRMLFTKAYSKLDEKLNEPPASEAVLHDLRALFIILQEKAEQLFALDERMKDFFLDDPDYDEDELMAEISSTDQYSFKWQQIKSRYEAAVTAKNVKEFDDLSMYSDPCCTTSKPSTSKCKGKSKTSDSTACVSCYPPKKSYRLPKIELRKFDGNLKSWLGFWGQFRKIDDDDGIDDDDKFQYLYQSTVPGSPARELVDSFPPSGANYKKAIEQLKERFARDDLLIEIYVPTAACLASAEAKKTSAEVKKKDACIWCSKSTHSSLECYKANKMTVEERKQSLSMKGACFNCLKVGHTSKICKNANKCIACNCKHSVLLCSELDKVKLNKTQAQHGESSQSNAAQKIGSTTFLQTLMVNVCSGNKSVRVRAFLDNGAQKSYIREDVAKHLHLQPVGQESLRHCLFGGITTDKETHNVFEFKVQGVNKEYEMTMTALEKKTCCGPIPRLQDNHSLLAKLKANNIVLSDCGPESPEIGLLIGSDYSGAIRTSESLTLEEPNLIVVKTKLGWTLQGPVRDANVANYSLTLANNIQIQNLWELEAIGINDPAETISRAKEESEAMDSFLEKVKINEEGRYEVDLPWKASNSKLLNNKELAEKRLTSTTKKLLKLDEFDSYDKVFREWLDLEIIEKVDDVEDNSGHYLSHHAVIKESSLTSRVRPVFNASAKDKNGNSLNSLLDKGINLLDLIMNLVIQFRLRAIGITSDIKKAFLQISLKPEDRNFLKFLWWKNKEMKEMIVYRHCRVVFGLTCSPFLLAATINHHLGKYEGKLKESADRLKASFYVDNCVTSLEIKEETEKFISDAKSIMLDAKFELRGWITAPFQNVEMTGAEENISVLGLTWLIKEDQLKCHYDFSDTTQEKVSKRQLLSVAQRVFDPVGFTCPTMLVPKLILQKAWQREPEVQKTRECSWDVPLPDDLCEEFRSWKKHVHLLSECIVPRRLTTHPIDKCDNTLHVFCDASKASYATCIFLRSEMSGEISVQLVLAKARVAPSRAHVTMPRLELLAALIASRLYKQVRSALDAINFKTIFWTDSSIALTWITSHGDWKVFVKNRVEEIRNNTEGCEWRHIAGNLNPADLPSRGCNAKTLVESKWWDGPSWLKQKSKELPKSTVEINTEEVDKERMKNAVINVNLDKEDSEHDLLTRLTRYFSKFKKIVRLLAWILRFTNNCKKCERKGEITYDEYKAAEKKLMKLVQEQYPIDKKLKIKDKYLFVDEEGIVRLRTKLLLSACFIHNMATSEVPDLDEIDEKSLNRRLRFVNSVRRNLRARFRAEYTSMLIQKGKESSRTSTLRIGDVVLIESPGKRIDWPIAVVKELHEGRDGVARVAILRTANGECTRAVKRLILLTSSDELLPPPGACSGSP